MKDLETARSYCVSTFVVLTTALLLLLLFPTYASAGTTVKLNIAGDNEYYIDDVVVNLDKTYSEFDYTSNNSKVIEANAKHWLLTAAGLGEATVSISGYKCDGTCRETVYLPNSYYKDPGGDVKYGAGYFFTLNGEVYTGIGHDSGRDYEWRYDEETGQYLGWLEVSREEAFANYDPDIYYGALAGEGDYCVYLYENWNNCITTCTIPYLLDLQSAGYKITEYKYLKLVPLETHYGDSKYKVHECQDHYYYGYPYNIELLTQQVKIKTYADYGLKQCQHFFKNNKYSIKTLTRCKTIQASGKFLAGSGYTVQNGGKYISLTKTGRVSVKYKLGSTVHTIKIASVHSKDELINATIRKIKNDVLVPGSFSLQRTYFKEDGTLVVKFTAKNRYGVRVNQTAYGWYNGNKAVYSW